jgi:hypothetical protein
LLLAVFSFLAPFLCLIFLFPFYLLFGSSVLLSTSCFFFYLFPPLERMWCRFTHVYSNLSECSFPFWYAGLNKSRQALFAVGTLGNGRVTNSVCNLLDCTVIIILVLSTQIFRQRKPSPYCLYI